MEVSIECKKNFYKELRKDELNRGIKSEELFNLKEII